MSANSDFWRSIGRDCYTIKHPGMFISACSRMADEGVLEYFAETYLTRLIESTDDDGIRDRATVVLAKICLLKAAGQLDLYPPF